MKRKIIHPLFFNGTIGGITFYTMYGQQYVRSKSSLTRKRVKTDKAFRKTMENAGRLGKGAKIAAVIYQALPGYLCKTMGTKRRNNPPAPLRKKYALRLRPGCI